MKYNFYPFNEKGKDYELISVKDNKAVIKMKTTYMRSPYNGYVTFPTKDIPKDWWGNDNAGALQYLDIHGGITFCECYNNNVEKNKEYINKTKKKIEMIKEKDYMKRFNKQQEERLKANIEVGEIEDSYIVFGFDCAHSGDEDNSNLQNPDYVMELTERMEQQLIDYSKIYEEWKKMGRKEQIEAIEEITGEIKINELGFGAMIDILAGGKIFKKGGKSK